MSALRQSLTRRSYRITLLVAAGLVATAVLYDWSRPASAQVSGRFYRWNVEQIYQAHIRPITSHFVHCRFRPTCSSYSLIAVQSRGLPKGLWLTVKRLARCQPWVPRGTYDPPPFPEQKTINAPATAAVP